MFHFTVSYIYEIWNSVPTTSHLSWFANNLLIINFRWTSCPLQQDHGQTMVDHGLTMVDHGHWPWSTMKWPSIDHGLTMVDHVCKMERWSWPWSTMVNSHGHMMVNGSQIWYIDLVNHGWPWSVSSTMTIINHVMTMVKWWSFHGR